MKRLLIRVLAVLPVLLVSLPITASQPSSFWAHLLHMRVIDAHGHGVPNVRVASDDGIVCRTRADGSVGWTETSVMNRKVRFQLDVPGVRTNVTVYVTPDGREDITIAE